jgi:hypothetical protein
MALSISELTDGARAAVDCQTMLWSGFKFTLNARRYKAQ